jgi:hypothetical protein
MKSWATLRELVAASIPARLKTPFAVEKIMNDVLHRRVQIWEVLDETGRLAGVVVTRLVDAYYGGKSLAIVSFLLYDHIEEDALRAGWQIIKNWAVSQGATSSETVADHPKVAHFLKTLGFELLTYAEVRL